MFKCVMLSRTLADLHVHCSVWVMDYHAITLQPHYHLLTPIYFQVPTLPASAECPYFVSESTLYFPDQGIHLT